MKTIKIKGKDYIEVNERIKFFRENFPDYSLTSEVIEKTPESILIKATIKNQDGVVVATGMAEEIKGTTYINETSYVENCETSAWGRALGNFGIGIDTSVASADEVVNATNSQKQQQWLTQTQFVNTLKGTKKQAQNVLEKYKMKKEYRNEILTKFKIK
ncbi:MAG: hypothetical protein GOVbin2700_28 [Prokaryotic dsDNA virus sp.]|nr:MAG: hypothetical protein GOVbin2700_28 [Prokaryotic dsDNA virus sp.]|tara:strand:+ start:6333 stop:6809 length:477 start_codon:yes stop_codon:yes gene_type:complete